jgi:alpha-tubulin suppressor-like RCC1 family protein
MSTATGRFNCAFLVLAAAFAIFACPAGAYDGGALSAGNTHSCQVASGQAQCWGSNAFGQLGIGDSSFSSATPKPAVGLANVVQVSAGHLFTCVVNAGEPWCFGRGTEGQLGNGTNTAQAHSPVKTLGTSANQTLITAGVDHACSSNGSTVFCWGENGHGQLGTGDNSDSNTAQTVNQLYYAPISSIAAGDSFTCQLTDVGAVKCWGLNNHGQLGNGDYVSKSLPQNVSGMSSGVTAISAGQNQACAVKGGAAYCWGRNFDGQLGIGTVEGDYNTPQPVVGLASGVTAISAGNGFSCAVQQGVVKCWGDNTWGQLGNGQTGTKSATPVVASEYPFSPLRISVGDKNGCAFGAAGQKCWGLDQDGSLGQNTTLKAFSFKLKRSGKPKVKGKSVKFKLKATTAIPTGAPAAAACNGSLKLSFKPKGAKKTLKASGKLKVSGKNCVATVSLKLPKKYKGKKIKFKATHPGNAAFLPLSKSISYKVK